MKSILVLLLATFLAADVLACAAITKKGTQCKRAPASGSIYCWQHGGSSKSQGSSSRTSNKSTRTYSSSRDSETITYAEDNASPVKNRAKSLGLDPTQMTKKRMNSIKKAINNRISKGKPLPSSLDEMKSDVRLNFRDEWGRKFRYEVNCYQYKIISAGPDKEFDTDDDLSTGDIDIDDVVGK